MRHRVHGRKLGRPTPHRIALLRNLCTSLFEHERVTTTVQKAKEMRPVAEKLITLGKVGSLHARRQAAGFLLKAAVLQKLFDNDCRPLCGPQRRLHAHHQAWISRRRRG